MPKIPSLCHASLSLLEDREAQIKWWGLALKLKPLTQHLHLSWWRKLKISSEWWRDSMFIFTPCPGQDDTCVTANRSGNLGFFTVEAIRDSFMKMRANLGLLWWFRNWLIRANSPRYENFKCSMEPSQLGRKEFGMQTLKDTNISSFNYWLSVSIRCCIWWVTGMSPEAKVPSNIQSAGLKARPHTPTTLSN